MKCMKCYKNVIKMIFCSRVIYFLLVAYTTSSELILKIDLNERTDKQTIVNYLNITFVNTTDSEHVLHDDNITLNINEDTEENLNGVHQLVKRNPELNPMYVSFHFPPTITTYDNYPPITTPSYDNNPPISTDVNIPLLTHIPIIQLKSESSVIKKGLDDFKMNKKRTYVSTPDFDFPLKRINSLETGLKQERFRRKDTLNQNAQIARETEIFDLISKQNKLIERIANKILYTEKRKKKIVRTVFDDILESVEDRYNKTTTTANVTITEEQKSSTILTLIDETEIRQALKKDPFVKRILRIADKKRREYLEKRRTEQDYLQ